MLLAERDSDTKGAQRYFRYMLKAREAQTNTTAGDRVEWFASKAFGLFSDYGASIGRPLLWVIRAAVLVAFCFQGLNAVVGSFDPADFGQAFEGAMLNVFRPFAVWDLRLTGKYEPDHVIQTVFADGGWIRAIALTVSTLQSLFSITCLFLSGLAARRKFQVR